MIIDHRKYFEVSSISLKNKSRQKETSDAENCMIFNQKFRTRCLVTVF